MADGDNPSFQTTRESVDSNMELQWGGSDGKDWSTAIDASTGITVSDSGSVQTGTDIPDSAIIHYPFDESSGSTIPETIGTYSNQDFSITGGPSLDREFLVVEWHIS